MCSSDLSLRHRGSVRVKFRIALVRANGGPGSGGCQEQIAQAGSIGVVPEVEEPLLAAAGIVAGCTPGLDGRFVVAVKEIAGQLEVSGWVVYPITLL